MMENLTQTHSHTIGSKLEKQQLNNYCKWERAKELSKQFWKWWAATKMLKVVCGQRQPDLLSLISSSLENTLVFHAKESHDNVKYND